MNTPYPATPLLTGFLKSCGVQVAQCDLSLATALRIFSENGVTEIANECLKRRNHSDFVKFFLDNSEAYITTIEPVISFLQGADDAVAWRIARRDYLPEGPSFETLEPEGVATDADNNLHELFGCLGVIDRAKYIASLYLDDIAKIIQEGVDPEFGFSRYAEKIALSLHSLTPLLTRLRHPPSFIDTLIDSTALDALNQHSPKIVGITIPFPGTLYAALRIAQLIKTHRPMTKVIIGGGYVNTELRDITDKRIFEFADEIMYDEGFAPWLGAIGQGNSVRSINVDTPLPPQLNHDNATHPFIKPDYSGIELNRYFDLMEMPNPMHRIWSDGRWLKLQLCNGCYWNKCAFCDTALDYIGRYHQPEVKEIVDCIEAMKNETGLSGFHFTDEALSPALIRKLCEEIISRGLSIVWWGNIRFENTFDHQLTKLMANAGCIAVTGGLECANDRLLKLMNKGITLNGASAVCQALSDADILVHAYLMYGFPTQTLDETIAALEFVRSCFAEGSMHSAYWHRFALTRHSPIARVPEKFNIKLLSDTSENCAVFAVNEIPYHDEDAPAHDQIGKILRQALYNYMLGLGLEIPAEHWFHALRPATSFPRQNSEVKAPQRKKRAAHNRGKRRSD